MTWKPKQRPTRRRARRDRVRVNREKREVRSREPRTLYTDRKGRRIGLWRWTHLWERGARYRLLRYTTITPNVAVSTVWVGIAHDVIQTAVVFLEPFEVRIERRCSHERQGFLDHDAVVAELRS